MELSKQSKSQIYDEIRGLWTFATPEERVRQRLLKKMQKQLFYPKELLSVEKSLDELSVFPKSSLPLRRVDIACFAKEIHPSYPLYPLLIIECKKEDKSLEDAFEQIKGYNHFLKAFFIAVAYDSGELFGYKVGSSFETLPFLPSYLDLIKAVQHVRPVP